MAAQVKLAEQLSGLIERGGYQRNRKKILEAAGISSAALSQYLHGTSTPSLRTLIALAEFFNVSLDYLVFGQVAVAPTDFGPLAQVVDQGMTRGQALVSRHTAVVARVGRMIADRLDETTRSILDEGATVRGGFMTEDESLRLERFALQAEILTLDLGFDLTVIDGEELDVPGRFLPTVASNLGRGATYRFLLAGTPDTPPAAGDRFLRHLRTYVNGDVVRERCQVRATDRPVISGAGLLHLDVARLAATDPAVHAQFADSITVDGWLGYVIRPNDASFGDVLIKPALVPNARRSFDALWRNARGL